MPNVVRGSKQEKMVVVPHRPGRRSIFALVFVVMVVASALGGFAYAYYQTLFSTSITQAEQLELVQQIEKLKFENLDLSRQMAILNRSSAMDQKATEEVQETISTLREQVASLEQDIIYYRNVVSEETYETGLTISEWDIASTNRLGRYRYKLVVRQQDADGDTFLIGHVNINLVGRKNEQLVVLPLRDFSVDQEQLDIKLRFKFFQIIEGELILPPGFVPSRVQIAAVETAPIEKTVNHNFSWVITE